MGSSCQHEGGLLKIIEMITKQAEDVMKKLKHAPETDAIIQTPPKYNWIKDLTGRAVDYLKAKSKAPTSDGSHYTLVINTDIIHLEWKNPLSKLDYFFYVASKTIFLNGELKGRYEMDQLYERLRFVMAEVEANRAALEVH